MLVIFAESAIATQPGERALDHPAPRQHHEPLLIGQFGHDFEFEVKLGVDRSQPVLPAIGLVGPRLDQSGGEGTDLAQHALGAFMLGPIRWRDHHADEPPAGIDQPMALAALHLFFPRQTRRGRQPPGS